MENLTIENFKAFRKQLVLNCLNKENVLIYGENGSGKTSLFEAFHLYYFRDKIFNERIPANVVEGRVDEEEAVMKTFCYDRTNDPMTLNIDGVAYARYSPSTDDQIFLLSYKDIHPQNEQEDHISIREMLNRVCFKYDTNLANWFDDETEKEVVNNANRILEDVFYFDGLKLTVSQTGDNICSLQIIDKIANKKEKLTHYFNEAILHLVRFVLLIEIITTIRNKQKPSLIVFDDCFNSLDAANRTFLMRYLLRETIGMQKIILTHNLSYYNLVSHILTTEYTREPWLKYLLCKIDGNYELKPEDVSGGVEDIIAKMHAGYYANSIQLGNAIRQEFEVLIYRLSLLCNIGAMSESRYLLELMCSQNSHIYFSVDNNQNGKTADVLVDEIYKSVTNGYYHNLQKRLKDKIEDYRANDILAPLKPVLVELRLLQKVALHQASHGHAGLPPVQSKEFDVSLALLKKIEAAITSVSRKDLSTI